MKLKLEEPMELWNIMYKGIEELKDQLIGVF